MKKSPTQLTLDKMRKAGCDLVQVVEKWNPHARIRQDLFGIVDVLAIVGGETVAIQSTSWGNVSSRIRKMSESESIGPLRNAGWRMIVHGWRKNQKTNRYECKEIDIS